ncbi:hypothetical protein Bca52824_058644 [Brassica carinata]|uniref:Uncharacterized protein n=1 Tax=Brassica carinata TaxID=52824 RepID=A0A8X7UEX2_BRACI|nr:hypothetical protein Bca52824_058644 [Brassica carinata]
MHQNSTQKPIELLHEIVTGGGGDDENLLIYCKPVRLYNILRIRSLFNMLEQRAKESEVVTDGEKSKSGKKGAKAPCAKPLSQYSQVWSCSSCPTSLVGLIEGDFLEISKQMMLNHQKLTQPRITSKITEEQLKASSPGKSQTEDQIQTQEPAVQSQPEVTSRETMAASPPTQD